MSHLRQDSDLKENSMNFGDLNEEIENAIQQIQNLNEVTPLPPPSTVESRIEEGINFDFSFEGEQNETGYKIDEELQKAIENIFTSNTEANIASTSSKEVWRENSPPSNENIQVENENMQVEDEQDKNLPFKDKAETPQKNKRKLEGKDRDASAENRKIPKLGCEVSS